NIREYGDGFVRCISMIIQLLSGNSSKIIIDEIDTGIHYTKLDIVWKTVLLMCEEFDIQLFATTHSQECIESYLKASKELNEKDIRLIRLQENKDKNIKAICYKEEYIEYMVESNTEER
ncbi:MAG: ATP-binding protein, partial [Flavobacteriaceae bacterium]|nr:ATP-binding protein [Flavobacteriaceae bacterium]